MPHSGRTEIALVGLSPLLGRFAYGVRTRTHRAAQTNKLDSLPEHPFELSPRRSGALLAFRLALADSQERVVARLPYALHTAAAIIILIS